MKLKFKHVDQLSNNKKARVAYRVIRLLPEEPVLNAFFDSEDVPENLELAVRARHKEAEELMNVNLPNAHLYYTGISHLLKNNSTYLIQHLVCVSRMKYEQNLLRS